MANIKCSVCLHPQRELVDELILKGSVTLDDLLFDNMSDFLKYLNERYPENKITSDIVTKHKTKHVRNTPVGLVLVSGQIVLPDGTPLPHVNTLDALRTIIAIGYHNMLQRPDRVTPTVMLEAASMIYKINKGVAEIDEFAAAWSEELRPRRKKHAKKNGRPPKAVIVDVTPLKINTHD